MGPRSWLRQQYHRFIGPLLLRSRLKRSDRIRIVIGAAGIYDKDWIRTEIEYLNLLKRTNWTRFFQPSSVDAIIAEHVWEHLTVEEAQTAANVCFEFLKPGGYLRIAVPDGNFPDPEYIEFVRVGGTGPGADDHKALHTHATLGKILENAGFQVNKLEYWDDDGIFIKNPWRVEDGDVHRDSDHTELICGKLKPYTSIIVDGIKPA